MTIKRKRFDEGLINPRMMSARAELVPPYMVYFFLLIFGNVSTRYPKMNLSAQGIMTVLAAMVVRAGFMP